MKRIATLNRAIDMFGPGKDGFNAAVPGVSEPTYLSAEWCNAVQESLVRVIESAGMVPSADLNQFVLAIRQLAGSAVPDLPAAEGTSLVGTTDPLTGRVSTVTQYIKRLPENFGRLDRSCLPVLLRAMMQYRLGDPTQRKLRFGLLGSSIGNGPTLPDPATQAPGIDFVNRLMRALDPAGLYAYEIRNYSVNGSTVSEWNAPGGPIDTMIAEGFIPDLCYLVPGMNDFATAQYNSGQGFNGFQKAFPEVLKRLKYRVGCDVVSTTSPHPSIVNYPGLNSLPAGIPQVYPTYIAPPVSDLALQPSTDQATKTIDYFGEGTLVTLSTRYLSGNDAIRYMSQACGVPCIDGELGWIRALTDSVVSTGSMSAAENNLFLPGQFNHPNLLGITYAYHHPNASFAAALARPSMQFGAAPVFNGRFALNLPQSVGIATSNPAVIGVFDVAPEHGDVTTPPLVARANVGPVDGYGAKSSVEVWRVDPATGNLVSSTAVIGGLVGMPAFRAIDHIGRIEVRDRLSFYNLPTGSTSATYTLPEGYGGSLTIFATQPGVALSQRYRLEFSVHSNVITQEPGSPYEIGANTEFTVSISGRTITTTILNNGTNIHISCDAW